MSSVYYERDTANEKFQNFLYTLGKGLKISPTVLERVKKEVSFDNSFRMIFCSYAGMNDDIVFTLWGKKPKDIQIALNQYFKEKFTVSNSIMQDVEKMRKIVKESVDDVGIITKTLEDSMKPTLKEKDEAHIKLVNSLDKQISLLEKEKEDLQRQVKQLEIDKGDLAEKLQISQKQLEELYNATQTDSDLKEEPSEIEEHSQLSISSRIMNLLENKKKEKMQKHESLEISNFIENYLLNDEKKLDNSQIDFILEAYKSGESIELLKKICNPKLSARQMKELLLLYSKGRGKRK